MKFGKDLLMFGMEDMFQDADPDDSLTDDKRGSCFMIDVLQLSSTTSTLKPDISDLHR